MSETWRQLPGFEGLYDVSDQGRIRSWHGWRGQPVPHTLTPHDKGKKPHLMVNLRRDGKRIPTLVHRAVLAAFVGPGAPGAITRHLDGDASNNALANLKYGTASENELDKVRHGTHQNASKTHCPRGHEYDEANTIHTLNTRGSRGRACRICTSAAAAARQKTPAYRAKRAAYMREYNQRRKEVAS